jgi:hypothetical protein
MIDVGARHVELVWVVDDVGGPIARGEPHEDLLSFVICLPPSSTSQVAVRRKW